MSKITRNINLYNSVVYKTLLYNTPFKDTILIIHFHMIHLKILQN